jgi:hypothetical protein
LLRKSYFEVPVLGLLGLLGLDGVGLIVPGVPVVLGVLPVLPPTPVLLELLPVPLVLLPELAPAPLRSSRRQSSFCMPLSASQRELPLAEALPLAPVLLLPLIPVLPLGLLLPGVCAIDTLAAPMSAAATEAHSIFIVIVGTPDLSGGEGCCEEKASKCYAATPAGESSGITNCVSRRERCRDAGTSPWVRRPTAPASPISPGDVAPHGPPLRGPYSN